MRKSASILVILLVFSSVLPTFSISVVRATEDAWTKKAPMQQARDRLGVAVVNGKIYAIGGDRGSIFGYPADFIYSGTNQVVGTNEEYNPETDTWTYKASMPTPRQDFGIAVYEIKIYCIGGYTNEMHSVTGANEVYDPVTDTWATKTPIPHEISGYAQAVVDDKIYVMGGWSRRSTQIYDPETDS